MANVGLASITLHPVSICIVCDKQTKHTVHSIASMLQIDPGDDANDTSDALERVSAVDTQKEFNAASRTIAHSNVDFLSYSIVIIRNWI